MQPLPPDTPTAPRAQRWFVLALLLLFAAVSVQYSFKARDNRSAILRWRDQIEQIDGGEDIYERHNYPNPPIMALLLLPLVKLPPLAAALGWFYLKVGMTLAVFAWVFRLVADAGLPFPPWAKALTVLLSLRPILGDLSHGNVNLFILFLVIGALYAFCRGRSVTAGLVLALAICCKVTPALFVPYFLWKRSWKTLAGCALGMPLFLWVVPGCYLGWHENARQLASWTDRMVRPFVIDGVVTSEHHNQSLPGLVARLATRSPSFTTFANDRYVPVAYKGWGPYHNVMDLSPQAARWLVKGCMLAFAALVVWSCRTPVEQGGWRLAAEFSLVVLGMLLFSERTWKHHCVTLVLPLAVTCYYVAACAPGRWLRAYLVATLALVTVLMAATSTTLLDPLEGGAKLAQVYGAYVWAYLLLAAAMLVLLRRAGRAAAEARRQAPGAVVPGLECRAA